MICLMSVSHEVPHEALRLMRKERARYRNGARFRFRFFFSAFFARRAEIARVSHSVAASLRV